MATKDLSMDTKNTSVSHVSAVTTYPWSRYGQLVLRLVLGITFLFHGVQNLVGIAGWDQARFAGYLGTKGFSDGNFLSWLVTGAELSGGVLLTLGLFTPIGAAISLGVMGNALLVKAAAGGGFYMPNGFEWELAVVACGVAVLFGGPGPFAVDNSFVSADAAARLRKIGLIATVVVILLTFLIFR